MDESCCSIEVEAIQVHIKILEKRKLHLETSLSTVLSVIDKCKSWIKDADNKDISFSDLINICMKTSDGKNITKNEQPPLALDNCEQAIMKTVNEKSSAEKIMARLEVIDDVISSIISSNKLRDNKIEVVTEKLENVSNSLNDKQNKLEKSTYSSGMKEKINKLKQCISNHEDLIEQLSDGIDQTDLITKEKFNEIYDRTSSVEHIIRTHENDFSEIKKDNILLESKLNSSDLTLNINKALYENTKHRTELENLEKKWVCSLNLLISKVQAVQKCVEKNVIPSTNKEHKIEHKDSELPCLSSLFNHQNPWMVTDLSYIKGTDAIKRMPTPFLKLKSQQLYDLIIKHKLDLIDDSKIYNKVTGIFTVTCDGIYLVNFKILNCSDENVMLAYVVRNNEDKICGFLDILRVKAINNNAEFCDVIYFKKGEEICLYMWDIHYAFLDHFAFVKLQ